MFSRFQRFMYGRYGVDELSRDLLWVAIGFSVIGMILGFFPLRYVSLAFSALSFLLIIYILTRVFSKNINRRVMENHKYLAKTEKIRKKFRFAKMRFRDRKIFRYVRCPYCKTYSRVPRGKGKIRITCRSCHKQFQKKV